MKKILEATLILLMICLPLLKGQTDKTAFSRKSQIVTTIRHKFSPTPPPKKLSASQGYAQASIPDHRSCYAVQNDSMNRLKYDLPTDEEFEDELRFYANRMLRLKSSDTVKISIPVIVHVIHNGEPVGEGANISAVQVYSQIDVLNEDFNRKEGTPGFNTDPRGAGTEISFAPALRDEEGNPLSEPGIHRVDGGRSSWNPETNRRLIEQVLKPKTIWDPNQYCNIWTADFGSSSVLGYAQFPNLSTLSGLGVNNGLSQTDGVVVRYNAFGRVGNVAPGFDGGRTTTHEIGHWLGLRHIWGDGDCSADDYCEDTPVAKHPNYGCVQINSCPELPGDDMTNNYMDYSDDACMNIFTNDQKTRMRTVMMVSPRRKELLNSEVHSITDVPLPLFYSDKTEACTGEEIQFFGTKINSPTAWKWKFYDASGILLDTFNQQDIILFFPEEGIYSVEHIASNELGSDTLLEENLITIVSKNELGLPYIEIFEKIDSALIDWVIYNPDGDREWTWISGVSADSGNNAILFDNYSDIDGDPSGKVDGLLSPRIDLSNTTNPYLTFDVAYARFNFRYSDTLVIWASTDCFESFFPVWFKGGGDLATAGSTEDPYFPDAGDWFQERISLDFLRGLSSVHFFITNWSGWGNNLFLDNIRIFEAETPEASFTDFYAVRDSITLGTTLGFSDFSSFFPNNWVWEFSGGNPDVSTLQNPYVTYTRAGSFDVRLTTSNANGGDSYLRENYITVLNPPEISLSTYPPGNEICHDDSIIIRAEGAEFYDWYDDRGYLITYSQDSLVVFTQATTSFNVIGSDRFGGQDLESITIQYFDNPIISLGNDTSISRDETLFLDPGPGFDKYEWFDGSSERQNMIVGSNYTPGDYSFYVTGFNGNTCSASDTIQVRIIPDEVGLSDPLAGGVKIHPNPASSMITITSNPKFAALGHILIRDVTGKIHLSCDAVTTNQVTLDVSMLSDGLYHVTIQGKSRPVYKRLIINH